MIIYVSFFLDFSFVQLRDLLELTILELMERVF